MNIRKLTSLTAFFFFAVMIFTCKVLYVEPQGRIAYWADWRFMGLDKSEWGNIHINSGFLFLIALILHLFYNWKPIVSYLKDRSKRLKVFTPEFNVALVIVVVTIIGTQMNVPPFSTIIEFGEGFKDRAAVKYGEPPYGHAELSSLKSFSQKTGLDVEKAMMLLKENALSFNNEEDTLLSISRNNGMSPKEVYNVIASAKRGASKGEAATAADPLPDAPPPGTGRLTLPDIISQYQLNGQKVSSILRKKGLQFNNEMTLKEIAEKNNMSPVDVFDALKAGYNLF